MITPFIRYLVQPFIFISLLFNLLFRFKGPKHDPDEKHQKDNNKILVKQLNYQFSLSKPVMIKPTVAQALSKKLTAYSVPLLSRAIPREALSKKKQRHHHAAAERALSHILGIASRRPRNHPY